MSVYCTSLACWQAPCLVHEEAQLAFDPFPSIVGEAQPAFDPFPSIIGEAQLAFDPFPSNIGPVDTSGLDDIIGLPPPPFGEGFLFDRQSTLQDAHGEGPPPSSSSPFVEFPQLSTEKAAWLGNPEIGAAFSIDYQGQLELQPTQPGTFEAAILYGDATQLESAVSLLKPGGKLVLQVPKAANANKLLLFAGLVDISSRSVSEQEEQVLGFKPTWTEDDVAPVTLKIGKQVDDKKGVWNVDLSDDTVELVDQDALLNNDAVDLAAIRGEIMDCGVDKKGAKKACKDCTCGLSDVIEADEKAKRTYKSACGSCGLGDAFRCGDCPYLGTPAFKPGEAVKLSL